MSVGYDEITILLVGIEEIIGQIICRASHTGDAIRVMYSSVSVGIVHVLYVCVQVQSTVCSCHTAACKHHITHFFCRIFVLVLLAAILVLVRVLDPDPEPDLVLLLLLLLVLVLVLVLVPLPLLLLLVLVPLLLCG